MSLLLWPIKGACCRIAVCSGLVFVVAAAAGAAAQSSKSSLPAQVTTDEVVREMVEHNDERAARLKLYSSERHYHLEYKGFPHGAEASMDVEATCDGQTYKTFRVLSQSGSHFLVDHVLKRLLVSEQEAARVQPSNALTPDNYRFQLVGRTVVDGRPVYELQVEPRRAANYLYRGEIWVDTNDYAVAQLNAEPAKSLSFWIRKVDIHRVYLKSDGFWLPQWDRSETKTRFGGTAVLTIDYGTYNFSNSGTQVSLASENQPEMKLQTVR